MKDVELLMLGPMMPMVTEALSEQFTLHRAWETPEPDSFVREIAPRVRGLAGGHGRVDAALFDKLPHLEIVSNFGVGYDTIDAAEAHAIGLVTEVVGPVAPPVTRALEMAEGLAAFPQETMLSDRRALLEAAGLEREAELGRAVLRSAIEGAGRFAGGAGRSGTGTGV